MTQFSLVSLVTVFFLCSLPSISQSQSQFEDLLMKSSADQSVDSDLNRAFEQLEAAEKDLAQMEKQIRAHGFDATSFVEEFEKMMAELPEAERAALIRGNISLEQASPELRQMAEAVKMAKTQVGEFLHRLDIHIQNVLDVSMAYGFNSLLEYSENEKLTNKQKKSLEKQLDKLVEYRQRYLANKHQYGEGPDHHRTTPFRNFFIKLKNTYQELESNKGSMKSLNFNKLTGHLKRVLLLILKTPHFAMLGVEFSRFVKNVFKPSPSTQARTALNASLNPILERLGKITSNRVNVEGRRNLPHSYSAKTINIYAPSHRDAFYDQLTLSKLGINDMVMFGAAGNFVPFWANKIFNLRDRLIKALNYNPGFIVVGPTAEMKPIDKAIQIVEQTPARSFLIFPGGRLPEGLGATMGVRAKFESTDGLLARFEAKGFRVNIVPISMRDNATLFDQRTSLTGSDQLNIRVGKQLSHETRRALTTLGGSRSVGALLRYALTEDLVTNDKLIWGQVRVSALRKVLDGYTFPERRLHFQRASHKRAMGRPMCRQVFSN